MLELAPQLQEALSAGHTVVVPTAPRAAAVSLAYASAQLAAGRRAFPSPDIQSLNGWLRARPPGTNAEGQDWRRPGATEEWLLWQEAVETAGAQLSLPAVAGLTDAVRRAAALLIEWQIPVQALQAAATPEAQLLARSLNLIEARVAQLGAVGSWQTLPQLRRDPPTRVPLLVGFAEHTPARRALLEAWARRGTPSRTLPVEFSPAPAAVASAADPAEELRLAAHWCRERLSADPAARVLLVVPDLARRRGEVRRVFDAALGSHPTLYAMEGGQPLLSYRAVESAYRTLQVLSAEVDFAQLSQWLREGFWLHPDAALRARLEVWLRTVVPPRLNVAQLQNALRSAPPPLLPGADAVRGMIETLRAGLAGAAQAPLCEWGARFGRVLSACTLTVPALPQRDLHTQQVLERLEALVRECAQLPPALGVCSAEAALERLRQLLARTGFEVATGDAAITLTATLADPIVRYDGIWVSGLHSGALPEAARFDPFIPVALQRQAGLEAADPARLVHSAQAALATLQRCSGEFILSAPRGEADLELTVSPLLARYAARRDTAAPPPPGWAARMRAARAVEAYPDEPGARWPPDTALPAGARAIELQSRCPFRAYAQLRLAAEPLELPQPGIEGRERGSLLHRALQLLWEQLNDSAGLQAARGAGRLPGAIEACVARAATEILRQSDADEAADATGLAALRRAAIGRERRRAERLIADLCELEAARAPFTVQELERTHRVSLADAVLTVRIDRLDRLADGSYAILDYKTGRSVNLDWALENTTQPQLLVYAQAAPGPVSALAVAHLDARSVAFKGLSDVEGRLPGLDVSGAPQAWPAQLAAWREQVGQLAAAFARGDASVTPVEGECEHCHLHALCRIADRP